MGQTPYDKIIRNFLAEHIRPQSHVIDVGCGTGWTALFLAKEKGGCVVEGIDINDLKVHRANRLFLRAKKDPLVHCQTVGVEKLPQYFGKSRFDIAVSGHSLHHYHDPLQALSAIKKILKPGGKLLLAELTRQYGESIDNCPRHSKRKILELAKKSAFKKIAIREKRPGVILLSAER